MIMDTTNVIYSILRTVLVLLIVISIQLHGMIHIPDLPQRIEAFVTEYKQFNTQERIFLLSNLYSLTTIHATHDWLLEYNILEPHVLLVQAKGDDQLRHKKPGIFEFLVRHELLGTSTSNDNSNAPVSIFHPRVLLLFPLEVRQNIIEQERRVFTTKPTKLNSVERASLFMDLLKPHISAIHTEFKWRSILITACRDACKNLIPSENLRVIENSDAHLVIPNLFK